MKPWERLLADMWLWLTRGRRRYVTIPIFLVFVAVPAVGGLIENYAKISGVVVPFLVRPATAIDQDERDLIEQEEWGLIVATATSEGKAIKAREEFKKVYLVAHHLNSAGQPICGRIAGADAPIRTIRERRWRR